MTESVETVRGAVTSPGVTAGRSRTVDGSIRGRSAEGARRMVLGVLAVAGRYARMLRFLAVGASGVVVNVGVMAVLVALGSHYLAASLIATELSIAWNFLLHERFVFRDRRGASRWWHRLLKSLTYNNIEYAARVPLLVLAVSVLQVPEMIAQTLTLILAFALRFLFVNRVVYAGAAAAPATTTTDATAGALRS